MTSIKSTLTKALTRNEMNILNLVHSALDVNPKLYNFSLWLNSPEFVNPGRSPLLSKSSPTLQEQPALTISVPIAFSNYNSLNGMGCGLKALDDIASGTILIK